MLDCLHMPKLMNKHLKSQGRLTIPLIKKHSRELMLAFLQMRSSHLVKLLAIFPIMLVLLSKLNIV